MPLIGTFIVPHPPLIIPEVGKGQEQKISKTIAAYQEIARRIAKLRPDTIIVTTPHATMYADYLHISPGTHAAGNFQDFGATTVQLEVDYDMDFIQKLISIANEEKLAVGTLGAKTKTLDHGTMVPLYFINQTYQAYQLVRISLAGLSPLFHYQFGKCIAKVAEQSEKKIIIVASGDLSHKLKADGPYGLAEEGEIFDQQLTSAMKQGDFLRFLSFDGDFCEAAAECGLRSFIIMAGALDGKAIHAELLSYEGTFGVGYAVAAYKIIGIDESRHFDQLFIAAEAERIAGIKLAEDEYVSLARQSLEYYVKTHEVIRQPAKLPDDLSKGRAGVFVSLKINGRLRGCIGTILPTKANIAAEIIRNAISAGTEDPRFEPVRADELNQLVYSVDVLGKASLVASIEELDVKRYGLIVTAKEKRGLLLPNLTGVDTPQQQVDIALQKAGISKNEVYSMERFEVVRHK
ncbi:MAG: AmmeMemoRadiSam system protein A [Clostridia bacterium]